MSDTRAPWDPNEKALLDRIRAQNPKAQVPEVTSLFNIANWQNRSKYGVSNQIKKGRNLERQNQLPRTTSTSSTSSSRSPSSSTHRKSSYTQNHHQNDYKSFAGTQRTLPSYNPHNYLQSTSDHQYHQPGRTVSRSQQVASLQHAGGEMVFPVHPHLAGRKWLSELEDREEDSDEDGNYAYRIRKSSHH